MKKIFLFLLIATHICKAQPFIKYWDKCYGGNDADHNTAIITTPDGKLIFAGNSISLPSGNKTSIDCSPDGDAWLVKTDTNGTILWNKSYGGVENETPGGIAITSSGNILVSCYTNTDSSGCTKTESGRGDTDCWIFMTDSNGNMLWDKTYGGNDADAAEEPPVCTIANTGHIVLANSSRSPISGDKTDSVWNFTTDYWILYLDSMGNKLWDKSYGGLGDDVVRSACITTDGNILVGGMAQATVGGDVTDTSRGGNNDYWVIKLDTSGNKIWDRLYGGNNDENLRAIKPTPDGGAIICGWTYSGQSGDVSEPPKGFSDTWLVKIDSAGNKQWDKRYGGSGASCDLLGSDILKYEDGYLVAAIVNSTAINDVSEPSFGGNDYWVMKIDSIGNKRWDKRFGGNGIDEFPKITVLPDNSVVVVGYSDSDTSSIKTDGGYGLEDYWAIRFKYNDSLVSIGETQVIKDVTVYPNPTTNILNVKSSNTTEKVALTLRDQTGKIIYLKEKELLNTQVNISQLTKGVYYLNVVGNTINQTIKVVKI